MSKIDRTMEESITEKEMQIGGVAARSGLSLRTIRYYEEAGLITPSTRTTGGFRLYTEADCARLQLIKQMKPLGFSLDEMRDLLRVLDELTAGPDSTTKGILLQQLQYFTQVAAERSERLRQQLADAATFADTLRRRLSDERFEAATVE